jgi:imidazolonepropionase-like amidohydrolase
MIPSSAGRFRPTLLVLCLSAFAVVASAQEPAEPGFRPPAYAITGVRIVAAPGQVVAKGNVVVRGAVIEAVGPDAAVPFDAEVIDGKGLTVTAGWIDGLTHRGVDARAERSRTGAGRSYDLSKSALAETPTDNRKGVTPEFLATEALNWDGVPLSAWRKLGFTAGLLAPDGPTVPGRSAVAGLAGLPRRESVLSAPAGLHVSFRATGSGYPSTLMGITAHIRQTLLDADHHRKAVAHHARTKTGPRPPSDPALEALWPALDGRLRVYIEADTFDEIHRALNFAEEFRLTAGIYGGREAYKVADRLAKAGVPVLLRIDFPDEPKTEAADSPAYLPKRLADERKRLWELEVGCAAALHKAGVRFAISTAGHEGNDGPGKFAAHLRRTVKAGLPADAALAAMTTVPAELFGVADRMGSLAAGRAAHLAVFSGDPLDPASKVRYVFADGVKFDLGAPERRPAGAGRGRRPESLRGDDDVAAEGDEPADKRPEGDAPDAKKPADTPDGKKAAPAKPAPEWPVEIEADRRPRTRTGGDVLIKDATLLTVSAGTIAKGSILIRGGKIVEIAPVIAPPVGVAVLDGAGKYVMPGIIDTHSHMAISGGLNESTLSIVPEVRVKDALWSADPALFRALTGGVTTARLLHGSANVIGGQDAVIKLKVGSAPADMLIADAPQGVKFALGENVKRTPGRFPNSRMGVEAVLLRAFAEARAYRAVWEKYGRERAAGREVPEPRRDLRLEALARVLTGDIRIHSHCYRADEILMLLRAADAYGIKVRSLQHGLEAYKIAPEIAAHGASVSTFSDWWAYKIEAADAIPHNVALMHEAGVPAVIKSDSHELVRHLFHEAAKTVKYGGTPEDAALAAVTLNAAVQLGLDKRLGSLEVGKDADLAIFDGHPFNSYSRVEMTLIDGEVWFERPGAAPDPSRPSPDRPAVNVALDDAKLRAFRLTEAAVRRRLEAAGWDVFTKAAGPGAGTSEPPTLCVTGSAGGGADALAALKIAEDGGVPVFLRDVAVLEAVAPPPAAPSHPAPPTVSAPRRPPLRIPASADKTYLIRGATVHPISGPAIPGGSVLIRGGRIAAVLPADAEPVLPAGTTIVDAAGLHAYPGLFDAGTILGLVEYRSAQETNDSAETGGVQPDAVAATAVNPDSEMIPVTRVNGVTTVLTRPAGGLVSGQGSVIRLAGWTSAEMTAEAAACLFVALGRPPSGPGFGTLFPDRASDDADGRKDRLRQIRDLFARARLYRQARDLAAAVGQPGPVADPRMDAMIPYLDGRRPVVVQADTRADILAAAGLADELKIRVIISGGKEAWKCADTLAAKKIPVILGPVFDLPFSYSDPFDSVYTCAARLHAAGVKFCFQSAGASNVRNLPYEAAAAVAHGLPAFVALRAVTLTPAEILGVSDRFGSLDAGKSAEVILTDGDPLQVTTNVVGVFIAGEPVEPTSKHTRLYERYLGRIRSMKK